MNKLIGSVATLAFTGALLVPGLASAGSHIIPAHGTRTITFHACGGFDLIADGDNDTDLDFVLYDPAGRQLRSDFDSTDMMVESIGYGRCGTYSLRVENLGSVYNQLDVSVTQDR